jgi:hypothetical protein
MAQAATVSSATYDESAYLRIAFDWWRRGVSSEMTRMGSPVTFFKLQAAPAFFALDRIGLGGLIDRPVVDQATLLPIVRVASLWIWIVGFGVTIFWSRRLYGPRAMALAACLFALSPNLLAHGSLMTMEMPIIAATAGLFFLFWRFLATGRPGDLLASATVAGLAFSCKFTAVVYVPILGLIWAVDRWLQIGRFGAILRTVVPGIIAYAAMMLLVDWALTGFAVLPPSGRTGYHPSAPGFARFLETPMPLDWVGFVTQLRHQRNGGPSYLLGERRLTGWWYYYPVALAVKVPLGCWLLIAVRSVLFLFERVSSPNPSLSSEEGEESKAGANVDWFLPLAIGAFLAIAMLGSRRNYGVRYLLPMAPLAIVWVSALAERRGIWRGLVGLGLIGQAAALATIHPHELSYFNLLAGGKIGGRKVLADSNLDWGQGLRSLAVIEKTYHPLTLFYFGDTEPICYEVESRSFLFTASDVDGPKYTLHRMESLYGVTIDAWMKLNDGNQDYDWQALDRMASGVPKSPWVGTRYVAVSASLQYGPWGPPGFFRRLDALTPVAYTDDGTIAIYDLGPQPDAAPGGPKPAAPSEPERPSFVRPGSASIASGGAR